VFSKFAGIITTIPICVLGGMVTFLFSNVAVSGIAIIGRAGLTRRDRLILAISLGVGIGVACQPNIFDPSPSSPEAFYGVNLAHNVGFWPKKLACTSWFDTTTTVPQSCVITNSSGYSVTTSLSPTDCYALSGTYTAPVSTTTSNQGNADECNVFGNCCREYSDEGLMIRTSVLLMLKTPYCIGTLLALLLNMILPKEDEDGDGDHHLSGSHTKVVPSTSSS